MAIGTLADVHATWNGHALAQQVNRALGQGVHAAAAFLASRVRELVSVPAPRRRVVGRRGKVAGLTYYRATTPAVPGAPPRKLSGQLRRNVTSERVDDTTARVGVPLGPVPYARRLELEGHPYLAVALKRWEAALREIMTGQRRY